ncbi:MAG: hypothetical protein KAR20_22265, partial [Candidatus Heimdallarchaeota archaeon]|nr:hypothetical protein [Candidatus Heimdallarchaeota archaeon]
HNIPFSVTNFPLWRWSVFNSPYYAHSVAAGIDIYPDTLFMNSKHPETIPIQSPVDGILRYHTTFEAPAGYQFTAETHDHLIVIEPKKASPFYNYFFRIVHIKPNVEVGSHISAGQTIGKLVNSGFFSFWTDQHIHLEIRQKLSSSPSKTMGANETVWKRAKGGLILTQIDLHSSMIPRPPPHETISQCELVGTCRRNSGKYLEVSLAPSNWCFFGDKIGYPVWLNGRLGLLDAGIPYYQWGGIIFPPNSKNYLLPLPSINPKLIYLENGFPLGQIISESHNYGIFKPFPISISLNSTPVRGLAFFIFKKDPILKIIPQSQQFCDDISINAPLLIQLSISSSDYSI